MQHTDKIRAEFEAWHRKKYSDRLQSGHPARDLHNGKYSEHYTAAAEQERSGLGHVTIVQRRAA